MCFVLLFVSCEADIDMSEISNEITLHPNLIIPIGGANITLGDILSHYDTQGKVGYGMNNEVDFIKFDSTEFKFNSLNFTQNATELDNTLYFQTPLEVDFNPNTALPTITTDSYFNLGLNSGNDRIDSIVVNSATFSFQLNPSSDLTALNPSNVLFSILFPTGKVRKLNGSSTTISSRPTTFGTWTDVTLTNFVFNTTGNQPGIPIQLKIDANTGSNTIDIESNSSFSSKLISSCACSTSSSNCPSLI